jgi:hypothetical protein
MDIVNVSFRDFDAFRTIDNTCYGVVILTDEDRKKYTELQGFDFILDQQECDINGYTVGRCQFALTKDEYDQLKDDEDGME